MWYQGSAVLTWQGGAQCCCRFSSRYQLLVSSKVWKRRENSWTSGWVYWRVRRVLGLQITNGPIRPEWRSLSWKRDQIKKIKKEILIFWLVKSSRAKISSTTKWNRINFNSSCFTLGRTTDYISKNYNKFQDQWRTAQKNNTDWFLA